MTSGGNELRPECALHNGEVMFWPNLLIAVSDTSSKGELTRASSILDTFGRKTSHRYGHPGHTAQGAQFVTPKYDG
jgi:hypothetical protein